jgi:hypothetical protein
MIDHASITIIAVIGAHSVAALSIYLQRTDGTTMTYEFKTDCQLIGENPEIRFWHEIELLGAGEVDDGITMLRKLARVIATGSRSAASRADAEDKP